MTELALIMVSAILVNNFVLVQFLGLCPFMGVSKKIETAIGLAQAKATGKPALVDFFNPG